ncbi:hypothetical protein EJD97_001687 [Solanum chilense]|uniref:Uncharacterized protein n=1 Tax=Solanum chilense TaxID=4083 RepID=A0A6N2AQG3_SOLCI|nr:hypothetical protein EJD97_001687 [Solanum chilense]
MKSCIACPHGPWSTHRVDDVDRGMPSSPLGSTQCRTTSGMTCHLSLWEAYRIVLHRAWHAIITLGQHIRLDDVGHGIQSYPLERTHYKTTSAVACQYLPCHAHTLRRLPAWHAIIVLGNHT